MKERLQAVFASSLVAEFLVNVSIFVFVLFFRMVELLLLFGIMADADTFVFLSDD